MNRCTPKPVRSLKHVAGIIPGHHLLARLIERCRIRYCRGVFRTFPEARAAIPPGRQIGYDNRETATLYLNRLAFIKPSDYAVLYWLATLLPEVQAIFDFGGNIGLSYYVFLKYLRYPSGLRWVVCDVPAVLEAGRELARQRKPPHLEFTSDFSSAEGSDVFFTSGTLQYVEQELPVLLAKLQNKPRHLLINRVPLSARSTYFTVQNIGPSCCPYRISQRKQFIESIQDLGYALIDQWDCPDTACRILFRPTRRVRDYTGMYFRLGPTDQ